MTQRARNEQGDRGGMLPGRSGVHPIAFFFRLYRQDPLFRGFLDFALIGTVVLAFLHLPNMQLGDPLAATGSATVKDAQASSGIDMRGFGKIMEAMPPATLQAPKGDPFVVDRTPFASYPEAQRRAMTVAADALDANDLARADRLLGGLDPTDPNVMLMQAKVLAVKSKLRDFSQIGDLLAQAAGRGQLQAKFVLGSFLVVGHAPGLAGTKAEGESYLQQAAEAGYVAAAKFLGVAYYSGAIGRVDPALSIKYLRQAAALGDQDSAFGLAFMAYQGIGMPKDEAAALRFIEDAAEKGQREAQELLGMLYLIQYLSGWQTDLGVAVGWLDKAAAAGSSEAMFRLGTIYVEIGKVAPWQDKAKGAGFFRRCAELWYGKCLFAYATASQLGMGTARDLPTAVAYYRLSQEYGQIKAKERLEELSEQMTEQDKAAAESAFQRLIKARNADGTPTPSQMTPAED